MKQNFTEIYNSYYQKAFIYVKSYVHDDMVAEDIVSESLIKLWQKIKENQHITVGAYLFMILKNAALDYLKHQKTRMNAHSSISHKMSREIEIRMSSLDASDPEDVFSTEIEEIVKKTLNSLSPKTQKVFVMSRFEGKSHKEIASLMKISVKGVDYHIYQTIKALKVNLEDYLPFVAMLGLFSL